MKKAYVRKLHGMFYVIPGQPENHAENIKNGTWAEQGYYTRRMAIRNLKKNGYDLVKRWVKADTRKIS